MDEKLIRKSHVRAWLIVFTGFMVFFMVYGSAYNCVGLFMVPMSEAFGTTRAVISGLFTVANLVAIPAAIVFGRIADKRDLKIPMALCCAFVGIGYIIYGTVSTVAGLYAGAVLVGIGLAGTIQIPVSVVINSWFIQKKGMAMGFAMVGSGVGGTVISQVISRVISNYGYSSAYTGLGIATIAITVPLTLMFVTNYPNKNGFLRYGEELEAAKQENEMQAPVIEEKGSSVAEALKKPEFWVLFAGLALLTFPMAAIKSHMVAYMTDNGYPAQVAANILTLTIIAVIPGKPLLGVFFDKLGAKTATIIAGLCMTGGIFLSIGAPIAIIFAILFGVIYGFGSAFSSVGTPLALGSVVKTKANFATLLSVAVIGANGLAAFGTIIMGAVYDATGTYMLALLASGVSVLIGYILVIISIIISNKKNKNA